MNSAKNRQTEPKKIRFKNDEAGFLLFDALAFVVFLSMMAFAVQFYTNSARLRRENAVDTAAIYIAKSQMSNLRSRIAAGENIPNDVGYLGASKDLSQFQTTFEVETEIDDESDFSTQYNINLKTISVTVKYNEKQVTFNEIVEIP